MFFNRPAFRRRTDSPSGLAGTFGDRVDAKMEMKRQYTTRLGVEALEDRRMLAVLVGPGDDLEATNNALPPSGQVLSAQPTVSIENFSVNDGAGDPRDTFIFRAQSTGKLLVQAVGAGFAGFNVDVRDSSNTSLLAASLASGVATTVPVVDGQQYWIVVTDTVADGLGGNYFLELTNTTAPTPASVSLSPASDTGSSSSDGITADNTPTFFIQDDLGTFLTPPFNGLNTGVIDSNGANGYDVQLVATNLSTGATTNVNATRLGTSATWTATTPALADGQYLISARTVVVDATSGGAGGANTGFSQLSTPIFVTIDAVADPVTGTIDLLASSDSGASSTDNVTRTPTPAFTGVGPQNGKVSVFAQDTNPTTGAPVGAPILVGTGTVGSDNTDGTPGDGQGQWQVTTIPIDDGLWLFTAQFEDAAGVLSEMIGLNASMTVTPNAAIPEAGNVGSGPIAFTPAAFAGLALDVTNPFLPILDVDATFNITHPLDADIDITLAKSGTSLNISSDNGGAGANYTGTIFDDEASVAITAGAAPFTGPFRPEQALSGFNGQNIFTGSFTATVADDTANALTGTFGSVTIRVEVPLPVVIDTIAPNQPLLDVVNASDTGRHNADEITNDTTPTVTMTALDLVSQVNLLFQDNLRFRIFNRNGAAAEALIFDSANVAAIEGTSVAGDTLTSLTFITQTLGALPEGVNNLRLEVTDRAGNVSSSFLLPLTVDTMAAPASFGDPAVMDDGLHPDSDTGVPADTDTLNDRITSDSTPKVFGYAEADSIVQLYLDMNANGVIDLGTDLLLGQTVALPYDGNLAFETGSYEITSTIDLNDPALILPTLGRDGLRSLLVVAQDLAGNPAPADGLLTAADQLDIFLDTQGPQVEGVFVTDDRTYDLFDPKPSINGFTPLVDSIDIDFIDQPVRGEGGVVSATGFVDLVVVMDESGSMSTEQAFIGPFIQTLDAALVGAGLGAGGDANQYGLVGFGNGVAGENEGRSFNVGAGLFGTDDEFDAATAGLVLDGSVEDGYAGVDFVLDNYTFRPGSTRIIVLVTDEDRDVVDGALNSASFVADLMAANTSLVSIVNTNIQTAMLDVALALDSQTNAYVEQPAGAFSVSPGGSASGGSGATVVDYVDTAFLVDGFAADLNQLRNGGNSAASFSNALLEGIVGIAGGASGFLYPAVNEEIATVAGRYQLVGDHVGHIAITPDMIEFIDNTVAGDIGRTTIRLNFLEPLPDDRYTLTILDSLTDDPGNALDGESNADEPQDNPTFPSGDGVSGGDFVVRFTVDSRPEIGSFVPQGINIDINGNFVWDPATNEIGDDATNVDLAFTLPAYSGGNLIPGGLSVHDRVFAGRFAALAGPTVTSGRLFDQLAAYGNYSGVWRWLIDLDSDGAVYADGDPDGVNDILTTQVAIPGVSATFHVGAVPVAGNFDGSAANGDEIGLYRNGTWVLDSAKTYTLTGADTIVTNGLQGHPVVGDFDGDGLEDLAVFNDNTWYFDMAATGGLGNFNGNANADQTLVWGFPGVLDRPVAADMDQDGIDDIGMWVPRNGATPSQIIAEWFFLVSGFTPGAVPAAGTIAAINHPFSPVPFGNDLFAQFGDELALPIVGNFDPPVASEATIGQSILEGDYNQDGAVDHDDYMVWRANYGANFAPADGNGDGVVNSADYSIWRDNMGAIAAVSSIAAPYAPVSYQSYPELGDPFEQSSGLEALFAAYSAEANVEDSGAAVVAGDAVVAAQDDDLLLLAAALADEPAGDIAAGSPVSSAESAEEGSDDYLAALDELIETF